MICPAEEMQHSAIRMMNRKMICKLTMRSSAVLLIGAEVALRISFVSWPVKTTMP